MSRPDTPRCPAYITLHLLTACALAACAEPAEEQPADTTPDTTVTEMDMQPEEDAALEVDMGDPGPEWVTIDAVNAYPPDHELAEGQHRFLVDTWGVEVYDKFPPAEFMLQLMEDEPEVFGNQFERFGFLPDPDDEFPIGLKRGVVDETKVTETCAACHVGQLEDGSLVLGLPNADMALDLFKYEVNERWIAAGNDSLVGDVSRMRNQLLGPGRTRADSDKGPWFIPVDYPSYFDMDQRNYLNVLGTGRDIRSEVFITIYNIGAGRPNDAEAPVPYPETERIESFVAFMGQMRPPEAPEPDDPQLATRGAEVFAEAQCSACHHPEDPSLDGLVVVLEEDGPEYLPGEHPDYPDGLVRTSYEHRRLIGDDPTDGGDEGRIELFTFLIRNKLKIKPTDGYRVPPLAGTWAMAPYLHNGSVPTLEDLLKPAPERPVTWMRGGFEIDTTQAGNSNKGHEFGVDLSDGDKAALVAYLKTL